MIKKKNTIENELKEVKPMIDAAKEKVSQIKYTDMVEIKNYKICPVEIRDVITGIMMFFKDYDCSWANMKNFLGKRSTLTDIVQ